MINSNFRSGKARSLENCQSSEILAVYPLILIGETTLKTPELTGREDSLTARFYIGYFFSGPEGENCQEKLTHHSPSRIFIDSS